MSVRELAAAAMELHNVYKNATQFQQYSMIHSKCWELTDRLDALTVKCQQERHLRSLTLQRLDELTTKCLQHQLQ